jgi:radical SAM protein with 4Fe4S-binding SPASM domain
MNVKIPKPVLLALEVTQHCRFHCAHCISAYRSESSNDELSEKQWKRILKAIANYRRCTVVLTGGEPMERADIYKLIKYAKGLGLKVALASCGYLIDEKSITRLKQAGLSILSLSIDGESAVTHDAIRQSDGSFDAVIKAAALAVAAKITLQINSTITEINIDEVNAIALLAQQLGAKCYNPFIFVPSGTDDETSVPAVDRIEYEILLNRLLEMKLTMPIEIKVTCSPGLAKISQLTRAEKRVGSVGGRNGDRGLGFINYKGDVQICGVLGIPAGNIVEKNYKFKKIWERPDIFGDLCDGSFSAKCDGCDYRDICGGCRSKSYVICSSVRR